MTALIFPSGRPEVACPHEWNQYPSTGSSYEGIALVHLLSRSRSERTGAATLRGRRSTDSNHGGRDGTEKGGEKSRRSDLSALYFRFNSRSYSLW